MKTVIHTEALTKVYGKTGNKVKILKEINLSIAEGEFVSIMGPSGCGKSTLLYMLGGIDTPTSGRVLIAGENISKMSDRKQSKLRRTRMGFIFQFYNLVKNLTVEENILLPLALEGLNKAQHKTELEEIISLVGLVGQEKSTPRELSGGQQQRVAIGRALIMSPNIILADEPIGNLDSKTGYSIMELFKEINVKKKITILQVTHSTEAAAYGDRIIQMKDGSILSDTLRENKLSD